MPLNEKAIDELMEISRKKGLNIEKLVSDINNFNQNRGMKLSRMSFYNLRKNNSCSLKTLDLLYKYSNSKGYNLNFYTIPKENNVPKT